MVAPGAFPVAALLCFHKPVTCPIGGRTDTAPCPHHPCSLPPASKLCLLQVEQKAQTEAISHPWQLPFCSKRPYWAAPGHCQWRASLCGPGGHTAARALHVPIQSGMTLQLYGNLESSLEAEEMKHVSVSPQISPKSTWYKGAITLQKGCDFSWECRSAEKTPQEHLSSFSKTVFP